MTTTTSMESRVVQSFQGNISSMEGEFFVNLRLCLTSTISLGGDRELYSLNSDISQELRVS